MIAVSFMGALELSLSESLKSDGELPNWIWATNDYSPPINENSQTISFEFKRTFEVLEPARTARLRLAADFCHAIVFLNDKQLVAVEAYSETIDVDAINAVTLGSNTLRIEAKRTAGPSAIAASLTLGVGDQLQLQTIVTEESWVSTSLPNASISSTGTTHAVSLGEVAQAIWGSGRRSAIVEPTENYEQWRKAVTGTKVDDDKFWTVPGFEVSLLRVATEEEGSWVSMAFDPQGRLTIAREEKGLLRMTFERLGDSIEQVELINDELLECRGLLYAHDALYANANDSKGLYRLRDTDGDDSFDDVRMLREFPGGVGHGRNDLALGPDGWIYSIFGDSVELPTSDVLDRTSPFRDRLRGSVNGQGHVLRTDPNGTKWEVLCTGLRNPFGLSVNPNGDWFTYDADAEFDMGTPWYRPTRVVQLLSGADYGWRAVTGKWPPYFPDHSDNAMPTLDIGKGSPTAVLFATQARFPEEYRRALLILDWTYGRILAVHMFSRGAGYRASAETFLQGRPLNVTDLAIGPDGALYLITGGRKTQSALYRVAYVGGVPEASVQSLHEKNCDVHAKEMKKARMQLESMHADDHPEEMELVWIYLDSHDWNLRHAARIALEHQPLEQWCDRALSETRITAAIETWLALVRSSDETMVPLVLGRLVRLKPKEMELSQVMGMLQCYSLIGSSSIEALLNRRTEIIEQIHSLFPHSLTNNLSINRCGCSLTVQGECARVLASLGSGSIVSQTMESLMTSSQQEQRLQGLFALRNVREGWNIENRRKYFQILNEAVDFVRGEGMEKFLAQIRKDATETLSETERTALSELLAPDPNPSEEFVPAVARPTVHQWRMEDLTRSLADDSYKPDHARGATIFRDAQCNRCHRSGARGPAVGPDLTHVASRFSRKDILISMIEPSQVVAENYRKVQITTTDGRAIVGRFVIEGDYRSQKLQIATDPLKPTEIVEIDKSEIESMEESPVSPMPTGLLDGFERNEILDLIEYLRVGTN